MRQVTLLVTLAALAALAAQPAGATWSIVAADSETSGHSRNDEAHSGPTGTLQLFSSVRPNWTLAQR
jgi:hypothetical protein